jgi:probable HAF family extracellular repeat protein
MPLKTLIFVLALGAHFGSANASMMSYSAPGAINTYFHAINGRGQVVGVADYQDGKSQGFLLSNGVFTPLAGLPGWTYVEATDINDDGDVVGWFHDGKAYGSFLRSATTGLYDVIGVPGMITRVLGINNLGQLSGVLWDATWTASTGFVRSPTGVVSTYAPPGVIYSGFSKINDKGQIVGYAYDGKHTGLYGSPTSPETFSFGDTNGYGLNNNGDIVGRVDTPYPEAFITSSDGQTQFWRMKGAMATYFTDINDGGEIVGSFQGSAGYVHGIIGTLAGEEMYKPTDNTVPEPATSWLLAVGAVLWSILSYKKLVDKK